MNKWIAVGQRIVEGEAFIAGKLWSSGYVTASNGTDIIDAFIMLPLPFWHFDYSIVHDDYRMLRRVLIWSRTRGWFLRYLYS